MHFKSFCLHCRDACAEWVSLWRELDQMGLCIVGPDRVPRPCQGGVQAKTDFFMKKSLLPFFKKGFFGEKFFFFQEFWHFSSLRKDWIRLF